MSVSADVNSRFYKLLEYWGSVADVVSNIIFYLCHSLLWVLISISHGTTALACHVTRGNCSLYRGPFLTIYCFTHYLLLVCYFTWSIILMFYKVISYSMKWALSLVWLCPVIYCNISSIHFTASPIIGYLGIGLQLNESNPNSVAKAGQYLSTAKQGR